MLAPSLHRRASSCLPPTACGQDDPPRGVSENDRRHLSRVFIRRWRVVNSETPFDVFDLLDRKE
jgi:hypothetical protein